ncbi:hypothetical protein WHR41_09296 [Cladosporium halotolerans]|uniref:Uncharacterized protein n=1 Tax=Cladosporium halotolerans TaxID=1052096 RepID=A0AB34KAA4_9PEZI
MADDPAARDIAATSDTFRELAKSAGETLNDATRKGITSTDKARGFRLVDIKQHQETLQNAIGHFELKEFPRLHPGKSIRWHKSIHIIIQYVKIGESTFGEAEEELLLLPLYVGRAEDQDKIGQPSSPRASFQLFEGDILLFYKIVAAP